MSTENGVGGATHIPRILYYADLGWWGPVEDETVGQARRVYPEWQVRVLKERDAARIANQAAFGELMRRGYRREAAMVLKCEFLSATGGVAADTAVYSLRSCEPYLAAAQCVLVEGEGHHISGAWFAATRAHRLFLRAVQLIPEVVAKAIAGRWIDGCCTWRLLSELVEVGSEDERIPILPACCVVGPARRDHQGPSLDAAQYPPHVISCYITPEDADTCGLGRGGATPGHKSLGVCASEAGAEAAAASTDEGEPARAGEPIRVALEMDGIGDVICAAHAVAGIRRQHHRRKIVFGVRQHLLGWARLFSDADDVTVLNGDVEWSAALRPGQGYRAREIPEQGRLLRHQYHAEACDTEPAVPTVQIPQDDVEWTAGLQGFAGRTVIVAPFAAHEIRNWPAHYFADTIDGLRARGYNVVAIDGPGDGKRIARFGVQHFWGQSPGRVAGMLCLATAFIGNDSGMAHLAGVLGRPGVVLCGSTSGASVYGGYASIRPLQPATPCSPCYWDSSRGYRAACDLGCEALEGMRPQQVIEALEAALRAVQADDGARGGCAGEQA